VNQVEAKKDKIKGESPNNAMLPPAARPEYLGKFLDAENIAEKYLYTVK
jgi:hypothetical protein